MSTSSAQQTLPGRIACLDGLRGVAALLVVVHHTALLTPHLVGVYSEPRAPIVDPLVWVFTYTPLHVLWDGPIAVFVFFVLSGLVLTLPFRRSPRHWAAYYAARLIRLYLPVWVAIALALLIALCVPGDRAGSSWVQGHQDPTPSGVARDLILVAGPPGATISALWSLRWEMIFSLALPVFVAGALVLRHLVRLKLAVLAAVMFVSAAFRHVDDAYRLIGPFQLSIFGVGCIIAAHWEAVRDRTQAMLRRPPALAAATAITLLSLSSYWIACAFTLESDAVLLLAGTRVIQVIGAAAAVILVGAVPKYDRALTRPSARWLGTRSFSLYLVHEPIVLSLGRMLPPPVHPVTALALAIPLSLVVTEVFFRLVERPSHLLSRRAARAVRAVGDADRA